MRYSEIDLQCEDIIWFGIDSNERIFACFSGGIGCVPEFVCRSREETELLLDYFTDTQPAFTKGNLHILQNNNSLIEDCLSFSSKGVYCFDVDTEETYGDFYRKVSHPDKELYLSDLPEKIRDIMADHAINVDVSLMDKIVVTHAY